MNTSCIVPKKPILLGYSDGPDSRYLLEHLLQHFPHTPIHLLYCHHGLRKEADIEAARSLHVAKEKKIDCIIKRIPTDLYQKRFGVSMEMAGHFLRKSIFLHYAKRYNAQVCTGHHANDAHENIQLKQDRGIRDGAAGLQYKYTQYDIAFLKPLLDTTKKDILSFLDSERIQYSIDESNANTLIKRNKIRQSLNKNDIAPHIDPVLSQENYYTFLKTHMKFKSDYCIFEKAHFNLFSVAELSLLSRLIPQVFQEYLNRNKKILPPYWNINKDHITALLKALSDKAGGKYSLPENHSLEWNSKYIGIYSNKMQAVFLHNSPNNKLLKQEKVLTFLRQRV